jgi:hypothetical protein
MPGAQCTRSRACSVESTRVSHDRSTETSGISCTMVLTVSFVLLCLENMSGCAHGRF